MILRFSVYAVRSVDEARDWIADAIDGLRAIEGVERVEIVTKEDPPRAGAIFFFQSREHLERYHEDRLPAIQEELMSSFAEEHVVEEVYEVEDM